MIFTHFTFPCNIISAHFYTRNLSILSELLNLEKKGFRFIVFSIVVLLGLSSILLFGILPTIHKPVIGIPGLQVSLAQERVYSSPGSEVIIECFVDTSEFVLGHDIGFGFTTNSTIDGFSTIHYNGYHSLLTFAKITLYPTSANIGETIEISIKFVCGNFFQVETAYAIIT